MAVDGAPPPRTGGERRAGATTGAGTPAVAPGGGGRDGHAALGASGSARRLGAADPIGNEPGDRRPGAHNRRADKVSPRSEGSRPVRAGRRAARGRPTPHRVSPRPAGRRSAPIRSLHRVLAGDGRLADPDGPGRRAPGHVVLPRPVRGATRAASRRRTARRRGVGRGRANGHEPHAGAAPLDPDAVPLDLVLGPPAGHPHAHQRRKETPLDWRLLPRAGPLGAPRPPLRPARRGDDLPAPLAPAGVAGQAPPGSTERAGLRQLRAFNRPAGDRLRRDTPRPGPAPTRADGPGGDLQPSRPDGSSPAHPGRATEEPDRRHALGLHQRGRDGPGGLGAGAGPDQAGGSEGPGEPAAAGCGSTTDVPIRAGRFEEDRRETDDPRQRARPRWPAGRGRDGPLDRPPQAHAAQRRDAQGSPGPAFHSIGGARRDHDRREGGVCPRRRLPSRALLPPGGPRGEPAGQGTWPGDGGALPQGRHDRPDAPTGPRGRDPRPAARAQRPARSGCAGCAPGLHRCRDDRRHGSRYDPGGRGDSCVLAQAADDRR